MKPLSIFLVLVLLVPSSLATEERKEVPCKGNPNQVGDCFTIHGRISLWNGTPSARIWRIGTRRILGVSEAHDPVRRMPASLEEKLDWDTVIYADFELCPFTKEDLGTCSSCASNPPQTWWSRTYEIEQVAQVARPVRAELPAA